VNHTKVAVNYHVIPIEAGWLPERGIDYKTSWFTRKIAGDRESHHRRGTQPWSLDLQAEQIPK